MARSRHGVVPLPQPRLYAELADWWPLLSPPAHYHDEAAELVAILKTATDPRPETVLELGAGGGSVAWHLKRHFTLTLTDRSPQMLDVSRAVNPDCEHQPGDMRTLDLQRQFDAVLIHDAIMYAACRADLLSTLQTAHRHCRAGGAVVVLPDFVKETFRPASSHGGEVDPDGRGLRYLEWSWDPDPTDDSCEVAYAFLLRDSDGTVSVEGDLHRLGLFPRDVWLDGFRQAGLKPRMLDDSFGRNVFIGRRPGGVAILTGAIYVE